MVNNPYYPFANRNWHLAHGKILQLGRQSRLMGILNVTPDSFSDGGNFIEHDYALARAQQMIAEGADIIDVGGESTRPGATQIDVRLEQERVLPVIKALATKFDVVISIDTYRASTANAALAAGAHLVNDVRGLQYNRDMATVIAKHQAGVCIMHNSRGRETADDLIEDQAKFLQISLKLAQDAGISPMQIVLDPGFGFGKDTEENIYLLRRFSELNRFGIALMAGTSRKRFTGSLLGTHDSEVGRDIITSATSVIARMAGCAIFRVHDVKTNKQALMLADAVLKTANKNEV